MSLQGAGTSYRAGTTNLLNLQLLVCTSKHSRQKRGIEGGGDVAWTCHHVSVLSETPLILVVGAVSRQQCSLARTLRLFRSRMSTPSTKAISAVNGLRRQRTAPLGCESFSAVESGAVKAQFRCPAIASPSADLEAIAVFRPVYHGLLISEDVIFLSHSIFLWAAKGAWVMNWVLQIRALSGIDAHS